jgi:competence protein ComEC
MKILYLPFALRIPLSALLFCLSCGPFHPLPPASRLSITFLDVGQGDASLIETASGKAILVDAGSRGCGSDTLLLNQGVSILDDFILSHPHEDHYGNLRTLLDRFLIKRVVLPFSALPPSSEEFADLLAFITDTLHLDTLILRAGESLPGYEGLRLLCLWPDTLPFIRQMNDSVNARSLVLRVNFGNASILLTGDMELGAEAEMLLSGRMQTVSLLKVAHHGSPNASSRAFLHALSPWVSIISAGAGNSYGHPDSVVLQNLGVDGGRVYRTDRDGTLRFTLDREGNVRIGGR